MAQPREHIERMADSPLDLLNQSLAALDPASPRYVTEVVDMVLATAREAGASDVHFQPAAGGLDVRWRIDGVLQRLASFPAAIAPNVASRLKVMAELLTYRTDIPQEGRIRGVPGELEMRVSSFPTLYGEKVVVRLFARSGRFEHIPDLGLPREIEETLSRLVDETSGAIVLAGPAGSGKTTTIYACLRELAERTSGRRSLATLEDPIEVAVPGVAQSQVNAGAGFDLATGLRSLLRQDPEVIAVGEIRDRPTAEVLFQASLTGHLVLTTFHAGSAAGVIGRLSDMGIEPYLLRSGILAIVCQRLVRRLCTCARESLDADDRLRLAVTRAHVAVGCPECGSTGYRGRMVLAEMLVPGRGELARAILSRTDVNRLESLAIASGMKNRWHRASEAVEAGLTSPSEVRRVLGFLDAVPTAPA
jgi:type II secretory ATPase GspE/PulE/Tfp pilus assembly ATPase PilB-like protein